jgi:phosphoserine phosphatase
MSFSRLLKGLSQRIASSAHSSNTILRLVKFQPSAGYGKITVLQELESKMQMTPDHTIYMGDGSSDLFVMLHVNTG